MDKSLIKKATRKKYNVYDTDGVRKSLKKFVEDFNSFVSIYGRPPIDRKEEHAIYLRWINYRNKDNLTEVEKTYLDENLVKLESVSVPMMEFVKEFKRFIEIHGRKPSIVGESKEKNLYRRYAYYKKEKNFNEDQIVFLKANGIISADNVRDAIKKFVTEFNDFVETHRRYPIQGKDKALCAKWRVYTDPKNLNKEELEYVQTRLAKSDNIRQKVKEFVEKYNRFISTYNKKPKYSSEDKEERYLCELYYRYTNAKYLRDEEIEFIESRGIKVKGTKKQEVKII